MKTAPIEAARIDFDADGAPRAPLFDDLYHPRGGALPQARHVFLAGNGLPGRWAGRRRFVVLETGFGLGNNFLATWDAWRADPKRCAELVFVSIEKHPPRRDDLARAHRDGPLPGLAAALVDAWPALTPNVHPLRFDGGAVRLLLAFGDVAVMLRELTLQADAVYLDGFAPAKNPAMWDRHVLRAVARLAAPGATAATWSVARELRDGLAAAGFEVEIAPGLPPKREMSVARLAPRYEPRTAPSRLDASRAGAGHAAIVGSGLAGAFAAAALADRGWRCTVFERRDAVGSPSPGGLFHGTVHGADHAHARFNRAAALHAGTVHRRRIGDGTVRGAMGLLRVSPGEDDAGALRAALQLQRLPPNYAQALDLAEARARAGVALPGGGCLFPGGGWLEPGPLVRALLAHPAIDLRSGVDVAALRGTDHGWQLAGADGSVLADAPVVVLANSHDAGRLLGALAPPARLSRTRGQISCVPAGVPGLPRPRLALAGDGYAIALPDGGLLCGATTDEDDDEPSPRLSDHRHNLQRLARLTGWSGSVDEGLLAGLVGWRLHAQDGLPRVGAVPSCGDTDAAPAAGQARRVARRPGLFLIDALGSRGLTWAPLASEVLAAWIDAAPLPLENSLLDAVDPARWIVRAQRRLAR